MNLLDMMEIRLWDFLIERYKMSKPREFEIAESNYEGAQYCLVKRRQYDGLIYDEDLKKRLEDGSWSSFKVIEFSAYEQAVKDMAMATILLQNAIKERDALSAETSGLAMQLIDCGQQIEELRRAGKALVEALKCYTGDDTFKTTWAEQALAQHAKEFE